MEEGARKEDVITFSAVFFFVAVSWPFFSDISRLSSTLLHEVTKCGCLNEAGLFASLEDPRLGDLRQMQSGKGEWAGSKNGGA